MNKKKKYRRKKTKRKTGGVEGIWGGKGKKE